MDKFYKKYTLMLAISIALGIIFVGGSLTYAYYAVSITGNSSTTVIDTNAISSINLNVTPNAGSLTLYKTYPVSDTEGESGNFYVFTISNPTPHPLNYNVYLEVLNASNSNTLAATDVKLDVANCSGTTSSTCTKISGYPKILSSLTSSTTDIKNADAKGYLIYSGTNFAANATKNLGVKLWQNIDSTAQGKTFNVAITVVSASV